MQLRREIKFVSPARYQNLVADWLERHPALFRRPYPARVINNIYFDTPNLIALNDNVAGISRRRKLRLRWYGEESRVESGALEIKDKRGTIQDKSSCRIQLEGLLERSWEDVLVALGEASEPRFRDSLASMNTPVLLNRYQREYFETCDGRIRATIDLDLRFWDLRSTAKLEDRSLPYRTHTLILEFKAAREDLGLCSEIMRSVPLRPSRHSKYVVGIQHIVGAVF